MVWSIKNIVQSEDEVIFFFDNCTDGSRKRFMDLMKFIPCEVNIVESQKDFYEIKANNDILRLAKNEIIVLFQDDIICIDQMFKMKLARLLKFYQRRNRPLGLIGGRSGFELSGLSQYPFNSKNYRVSNWEHLKDQYGKRLMNGEWAERTILNRGPFVFTKNLIKEVGYLDEAYYPLWGDDMDYSCRSKFTYKRNNVVFQCQIISLLEWGSTRNKHKLYDGKHGQPVSHGTLIKQNWRIFITKWGDTLRNHYASLKK